MKAQVLIVDDVPTNLQLLVGFLSDLGLATSVAEDGEDALEQAGRATPDLVLLDVMMPGLDGFETCRRLKAQPATRDVPVIFMTARSAIDDKVSGFEAGAVDYITKPFEKEEVIARVNAHLTIRQQRRELERMLAERERFMRIAAHDLRNPLTVLLGWIELGRDTVADPAATLDVFATLSGAVGRLNEIIDDFLDLRVLRAEGKDKARVFDLAGIIEQVLLQQRLYARDKGIQLSPELPAQRPIARGNSAHTHQVLTNYITNALKYSPAQTATRIVVRRRLDFWRVEVCDQGPGIAPGERQRLFGEFARTSNRPTGGETSTGLGLAIVKSLAEGQGGSVGAEFPETGGSLFWLELPASEEPLPEPRAPAEHPAPKGTA